MAKEDPVVLVRPTGRRQADPTPGIVREQAVVTDGMWAGLVRTAEHAASGWHHHGDHDTTIYVVEGALRLEFGPGGGRAVDAGPGDFVHVPNGVVHRESNPGEEESRIVVVRAGTGPPTVNVDGPDS